MNTLILYYSRSGNTEKLAKRIQQDLKCDIIKIEPENDYGNYVSSCLRVAKEKVTSKPDYKTALIDISGYDLILIGYPIWMQNVPDFFAKYVYELDLTDKTVIPFATYGGSDINWTMKTVKNICKGASIKLPFSIGVFKKDDYNKWIQEVKLLAD